MNITLEDLIKMLISLASGLGLSKILERRQASSDDNLKFLQTEISQSNQQWRNDLKAMIAQNHEEMMSELSAIKKGLGRANRLIETGNHTRHEQ